MTLLELDDPTKFRAKMRGVKINPFHMKDLSYRIQKLPDDVLRKRMKVKLKQSTNADELKKKV
jgi:hypothetical protein